MCVSVRVCVCQVINNKFSLVQFSPSHCSAAALCLLHTIWKAQQSTRFSCNPIGSFAESCKHRVKLAIYLTSADYFG